MTFPPEGPRPSGPGSSGYGNYGPGGQSYGTPAPGQQSQFGQNPPNSTPQVSQYNPPLASDTPSPLPRILALGVLALGVINFLLGLAGQYKVPGDSVNFFFVQTGDATSISLLLVAGLFVGVGLLPKQPNTIGLAAAASIAGWLVLVFQSFNTGDSGPIGASIELGVGAITVLVLGFIQSVLAVAATLFGAGILKAPQPKPVSYGQQNNFPGYGQQQPGYGQQPPNYSGYGQPQQQGYAAPAPGQNQGYVPPTYTGQPAPQAQNQPNQNTTGGLGYPVGTSKPESSQSGGLTGPAGEHSPYGQYQYSQPPVGSAGYGSAQHAAPAEPKPEETEDSGTPPYSAPTQAFGTTPTSEDKN